MTEKIYEKFEPLKNTNLVLNYITSMVDKAYDNLPYWLVLPHKKPAEAAHCRVDDAELVGSWYEGIDAARKILNTNKGLDVQQSFYRHLMKSWGEHGLRFHEDYPWSATNHSSFHEMGYILPALNRIIENNPEDQKAEKIASNLVGGLRSLVIQRKVRTFWSGDYVETEPLYEFPNDVYLRDGGFDLTRHSGRGEQAIRNSVMMHALVRRYELTKDEVALDLALGLANFLLGPSRYFNYKMEFFGHVHSTVWIASGLIRLGRITGEDKYIQKGRSIYHFVRSLSSSFGWVPEYAQWHPMSEEHCETCCIKDMIECANELIQCGYEEYWNDMNLFARNHLVESQIKYAGYVTVDNRLPDKEGITYRNLDKRIIGGFTGGSLVNSISLSKFRSIAGCCVGMAPIAFEIIWSRSVEYENNRITVNIPLDKTTPDAVVTMQYPNKGCISVTPTRNCDVAFRIYPWMGEGFTGTVNGKTRPFHKKGSLIIFKNIPAGETVEFNHPIELKVIKETIGEQEFTVFWKGCEVVDLLPHGEHLRLYQREIATPKTYPVPGDVQFTGASNYGPTQQKK